MKLDIGCGKNKKTSFIGLDIKCGSDADIIASALKIPIRDGEVNEVNCSHLVEHLYPGEAQQLFAEIYRVLKPGGEAKLLIDRDWSIKRLLGKDPEHKYRYCEKEIEEMVKNFDDRKVKRRIYRVGLKLRNKIFVEVRK